MFLDDDEGVRECAGFPVLGKTSEAVKIDGDKIIAIGNPKIRERIQEEVGGIITLIHPNAVISRRAEIDEGSVIMAGAVINTDVVIGKGASSTQ